MNGDLADRAEPIALFGEWLKAAEASEPNDPNAMALATVDGDGLPDVRMVLLKGFDAAGFVFFTNYQSAKARDLDANPRACLLLFWAELERQVRITGRVLKTSADESGTYFQSRPFESRIGAWASAQSTSIEDRAALETRYAELASKYAAGPVPIPPFWGGYRVTPEAIEFWQGRRSRLHDRLLYSRTLGGWTRSRLAP